MDWYSWLSKTNLEPTLAYEYALAFARNELQSDDINYFNHEFLQSIGISIAKHRLEILKLARKDVGVRKNTSNGFSKLVLAMNKTRKKLSTFNISKLGFHHKSPPTFPAPGGLSPYKLQRVNTYGAKEVNRQFDQKSTGVPNTRNVMRSGPLEKRVIMQDNKLRMMTSRSNSVSGPLDGKMQMYPNWSPIATRRVVGPSLICRSPTISAPIDRFGLSPKANYYDSEKLGGDDDDDCGDGAQSLWSLMFQDMKPT